jgi:hypothetical protein
MHPQCRQRHIRIDDLIMAQELNILLWFHGRWVLRIRRVFDALGDVADDLFGAEHAVGVKAGVAVGGGDGGQLAVGRVGEGLEDEGNFDGVFEGHGVLLGLACAIWAG